MIFGYFWGRWTFGECGKFSFFGSWTIRVFLKILIFWVFFGGLEILAGGSAAVLVGVSRM